MLHYIAWVSTVFLEPEQTLVSRPFRNISSIFNLPLFRFMSAMTAKKMKPAVKTPGNGTGKLQAENLSHTRREHASEVAEDYLEAIADLIAESGEARVVDIAKRIGVTHVTVIRTIERLRKMGFATAQPYRAIFLTDKGRALAAACKNRHEIVVAFLRSLGVPGRVAEMDAEGIEHHVSPETLAAFKDALRNAGQR
jgi:DtxR family transcriptional regulator, manganese transport regulator